LGRPRRETQRRGDPRLGGDTTAQSARSTKIKTLNQIRHLGFTAPDELRQRLQGCSRAHLASEAAALRPPPGGDPVITATKTVLRILGRRVLALDEEKAALDELSSVTW
jgi:hypothetical protein